MGQPVMVEQFIRYCTVCGTRFNADCGFCVTCSDTCKTRLDEDGWEWFDQTIKSAVPKALEILGYGTLEECKEAKIQGLINTGYIYFIQGRIGGPIKIGYSTDVEGRLAGLQNASPDNLKLVASFKGNKKTERQLHEKFARFKLRGEWFEPESPILEYIAGLQKQPV